MMVKTGSDVNRKSSKNFAWGVFHFRRVFSLNPNLRHGCNSDLNRWLAKIQNDANGLSKTRLS